MNLEGNLLTEDEARARVRPLRSWPVPELERVRDRVADALRAWSRDWGVDPAEAAPGSTVRCAPPGEADEHRSDWEDLSGAGGAWWCVVGRQRLPPAALARSELSCALFGEDGDALGTRGPSGAEGATASLAMEVSDRAWADLLTRVTASVSAPTAPGRTPPAAVSAGAASAPWSGGLVVVLPWWRAEVRVLLAVERVERLVPKVAPGPHGPSAHPIQPPWRALAGRTVKLRVQLESFDVAFGDLAAMRPGHVIATSHALEQPLQVTLCADGQQATPVCEAFLGRSAEARAIELLESK